MLYLMLYPILINEISKEIDGYTNNCNMITWRHYLLIIDLKHQKFNKK